MPNRSTQQYYFNHNSISSAWFKQQTPSIVFKLIRKCFLRVDEKKSKGLKKPIFLNISSLLHTVECGCVCQRVEAEKVEETMLTGTFKLGFFHCQWLSLEKYSLTEWNHCISLVTEPVGESLNSAIRKLIYLKNSTISYGNFFCI